MKILFLLASTFFIASSSFATIGGCKGVHQGKRIQFDAAGQLRLMKVKSGTGALSINGQERARFSNQDLRMSVLRKSFVINNGHGDLIEGKLTNLQNNTGVVTRLSLRGYGIDWKNIPVRCWMK